jgi:hypothetical protein
MKRRGLTLFLLAGLLRLTGDREHSGWWYAVLAMTSGFNHAVVEGLPAASDLRNYEQQARLATIADPCLRQEASDFFCECYVPARSKY